LNIKRIVDQFFSQHHFTNWILIFWGDFMLVLIRIHSMVVLWCAKIGLTNYSDQEKNF